MKHVAVIGSGASGLAAAFAAAQGGARVSVYEAHDKLGGTTALSGGNAWLPAHAALEDDTPELALAYLRKLALGDADDEMLEVFAREAGPAAERLQRDTPVRLQSVPYCDYHAEFEGGREQGGRTLEPQPYDPTDEVRELLRDAPNVLGPVTYVELSTGTLDRELLAERRAKGTITLGRALLAGLLQACLDLGVDIYPGTRLRELPDADAVVLATGGFERDPELAKHFLRGPMLGPVGAPTARGDGLRMAIGAGAQLGNMSEAWWCPAISVPGETIDGAPMFRLILAERARPGTLIVDGGGRRFVNEAQNYNDLGRTLQNFNPAEFRFPHVPAWMIFDNAVRTGYRLGPLGRRDPDPDWLIRGETVAELARGIEIEPAILEATVERFNAGASAGEDPDFGRGSYPYDRFIGRLGALGDGPYFAVAVLPGCLSTKGGAKTDADGRVLSIADGQPIPGLYAAGNVSASCYGMAYPGAGGTLGPALTFGLRAGDAAAAD
ncbi:MAG TPA: FAD-dependent oxidoreductase [Solirubrobacteraceae bacterium]|nr:FAD-dependent oxidoreductase [Solirubrobacteraceae bacterium]